MTVDQWLPATKILQDGTLEHGHVRLVDGRTIQDWRPTGGDSGPLDLPPGARIEIDFSEVQP